MVKADGCATENASVSLDTQWNPLGMTGSVAALAGTYNQGEV